MAKRKQLKPTDAELAILNVLWDKGPTTVRTVHETIGKKSGIGYTTVLKTMQIMHEKSLVTRNEDSRAHIYKPKHSEEKTQLQLVKELMRQAFKGSSSLMVMRALGQKNPSKKEIGEIRMLLSELEKKAR